MKQFEHLLTSFASMVPVELFVILGSIIEEIVAPIPSPLVPTLTGSIAKLQNMPIWYLFILSILGAVGKTCGATIFYFLADKLEDVILTKFGKLIGVGHKEIETIGSKFGKGKKDFYILFPLRSIPFMPSTPISLACGLFKTSLKSFVLAAFLGTIIRDSIFLYFGYAGAETFSNLTHGFEKAESILTIIGFGLLGLGLMYLYYKIRIKKNYSKSDDVSKDASEVK